MPNRIRSRLAYQDHTKLKSSHYPPDWPGIGGFVRVSFERRCNTDPSFQRSLGRECVSLKAASDDRPEA